VTNPIFHEGLDLVLATERDSDERCAAIDDFIALIAPYLGEDDLIDVRVLVLVLLERIEAS
jgi:hypothetical protein